MATHPDRTKLTPANYDFALLGRETIDGHDCYVLESLPNAKRLSWCAARRGWTQQSFDLRRIAGKTAKSPSFWIKNLNVTINYGEVNGVWVQTSTQAVADVRIAGPHVLTSRELDVQTSTFSARVHITCCQARTQRSSAHRDVADTATWVAR